MVPALVNNDAKLDIIGVSEGAVRVSLFLENEENFKVWEKKLGAFAALATYFHAHEIKNKAFGHWLRDVCLFLPTWPILKLT